MRGKRSEEQGEVQVFMGGIFVKHLLHFEIHCRDCEYSVMASKRQALQEVLKFRKHRKEKHELIDPVVGPGSPV